MDIVLHYADRWFLTPFIYPEYWKEDDVSRQFLSLLVITNFGAVVLYLLFATASYYFVFDQRLLRHPLRLKNQVSLEIRYALRSMPFISIPTVGLFFLEVRGYSRLHNHFDPSLSGFLREAFSITAFLLFTDMFIYWIHRFLHHPLVYKHIHKPHHNWKVPTPFASHAFHPVDGFLQSLPYHVYVFMFPLNKAAYLVLYVLVNVWTISIHDCDYRVPELLRPIINGSAHHTDHHLYFDCNYGQYLTLWDRIGGSYKHPSSFQGQGPKEDLKKMK